MDEDAINEGDRYAEANINERTNKIKYKIIFYSVYLKIEDIIRITHAVFATRGMKIPTLSRCYTVILYVQMAEITAKQPKPLFTKSMHRGMKRGRLVAGSVSYWICGRSCDK